MKPLFQICAAPLILCAALCASQALAEDIEGLVRIVGNDASAKVILTPESGFSGPNLCAGADSSRLRALESMVIKVSGSWKAPSVTEKCFSVTSYSVLKTPEGRPALTGMLTQKAGVFQVVTTEGETRKLDVVPDALRKLEGKKVIIDLKPTSAPGVALTDMTYKPVYFLELP